MKNKRLYSFLLTAVMLVSLPLQTIQAQANDVDMHGVSTLATVDGYSFQLTELINEYAEVRVFERAFIPFSDDVSLSETRALLLALGKNEYMIDLLSEEELLDFATSPRIYASTSFMEEDEYGNTRYVTRQEALTEAAYTNQVRFDNAEMLVNYGIEPLSTRNFGHIQVTHLAVFQGTAHGGNEFLFTTSASWLSMPFFRNFGSIGSVAQNVAISRVDQATFSYTYRITTPTGTSNHFNNGTASNQFTQNNNLMGAAAIFRLPSDGHTSGAWATSVVHSNFTVTARHRAVHAVGTTPFNSRGTYTHRTVNISLSPSISISGSGATMSIGIGVNFQHNTYSPPMLIISGTSSSQVQGT